MSADELKHQETERRVFELCLATYRVSESFPGDEILKSKARQLSAEIVGEVAVKNFDEAILKIVFLQRFLKIAQALDFGQPINFIVLRQEYQKVKDGFGQPSEEKNPIQEGTEKKETNTPPPQNKKKEQLINGNKVKDRQARLLGALEKDKLYKLSEIIACLPNKTSERTTRNDLKLLIKRGDIKRNGDNKFRQYRLSASN